MSADEEEEQEEADPSVPFSYDDQFDSSVPALRRNHG